MRSPWQSYRALFSDRDYLSRFLPVVVPIILQNLASSLTSFSSGLLVGRLGIDAMAGVSLAGQVQFLMILTVFGVGSGASIFTSQFWGRGNTEGVARTQGVGLLLSLVVGLVFAVLALVLPEALLGLFTPDHAVVAQGTSYLRASAWSFPLFAVGMSYSLVLRSVGDAKTPFRWAVVSLVVQVSAAVLLIFGWGPIPALGVAGAGWALTLARFVESAGLVITVQILKRPNAGFRLLFRFGSGFVRQYLRVATPVVVSEILWALGMSAIKAIYGWMGADELAAVAVVETFSQVVFIVFFGTGNAAAVIIGQAIGRGDRSQAVRFARYTALLGPLAGLVTAIPLLLLAPIIPGAFALTESVRHVSTQLIFVFCLLLPGKAFYHDMIIGVLRGGGDTRFSLWMDQSGVWLWALPLGSVLAFVFHVPFLVVYFVIGLEEPLKSLLAVWRLKSGRWIRDVTRTSSTH